MMLFESWHVSAIRFSDQSRKWNGFFSFFFSSLLLFTIPLSPFGAQGQTDKHKTIWKRSRETLETPDSQAVNKKERIHNVSGEKFMGLIAAGQKKKSDQLNDFRCQIAHQRWHWWCLFMKNLTSSSMKLYPRAKINPVFSSLYKNYVMMVNCGDNTKVIWSIIFQWAVRVNYIP